MKSKQLTLQIEQGMHMRPAGVLAAVASKFPCEVSLEIGAESINAKSIMMIMAAGIKRGTQLRVVCDGEREDEALAAVAGAIEDGLGE